MTSKLLDSCSSFNNMYRLPVATRPTTQELGEPLLARLRGFKETLLKEVHEIDDLIVDVEKGEGEEIDHLVFMLDLLGDICVYCHSEAAKLGLPLDKGLEIIMESNKSKLNADGSVTYDSNGKVQKGAFYWKPEPQMKEMLSAIIAERNAPKEEVTQIAAPKYTNQASDS